MYLHDSFSSNSGHFGLRKDQADLHSSPKSLPTPLDGTNFIKGRNVYYLSSAELVAKQIQEEIQYIYEFLLVTGNSWVNMNRIPGVEAREFFFFFKCFSCDVECSPDGEVLPY